MTKNMEKSLLLSIDIGTTACKAGVFEKDGTIRALSYHEYPLIHLADNFIEQDAEVWWKLVVKSISECMQAIAEGERQYVRALGISAQGISIVPVDEKGDPVSNAVSWLDSRAVDEAAALSEQFGEQALFKTTGIPPNPCFMLPKIMWLQKNRPEIYARADRICTCQDFIIHRLSGEYVTDHSIAGGSLMYDMEQQEWSEKLLEFAGIPVKKLPRLAWAGETVGKIYPNIAQTLMLPEDVLVVLGGHDQECAGIGGGLSEGRMTASLGTASIILGSLSSPVWDTCMRIPCLASVEKGKWVLEAAVNVGGAGMRWIRDALRGFADAASNGGGDCVDYEMLFNLAGTAEEGSGGVMFYPHMTGATAPYWSNATGMFHGITLSTKMPQIVRAVAEGWCYQIKHNVDVIQSLTQRVDEIVVFGGGAKSAFLTEMLANVLNMKVLVTDTPETALLGAAMVAGVGCGVYKDISDAQFQAVHIIKKFSPEADCARRYQELFNRYIRLEKRLLHIGTADNQIEEVNDAKYT